MVTEFLICIFSLCIVVGFIFWDLLRLNYLAAHEESDSEPHLKSARIKKIIDEEVASQNLPLDMSFVSFQENIYSSINSRVMEEFNISEANSKTVAGIVNDIIDTYNIDKSISLRYDELIKESFKNIEEEEEETVNANKKIGIYNHTIIGQGDEKYNVDIPDMFDQEEEPDLNPEDIDENIGAGY